jgi:poly(hydroxyalkanoate) granule-associated protein
MATKKTRTAEEIKDDIKANASKVWLAGLGALATAEEEGGKLFRGLVKKGEVYEKKGRTQFDRIKDQVETLAEKAKSRAGAFAEEAKERAGEAWAKVEETVEEKAGVVEERWDDKVRGVLGRVGVPSRNEIASLTRRVEELTRLVEKKAKPATKKTVKRATKPAGGRTTTRSTNRSTTRKK